MPTPLCRHPDYADVGLERAGSGGARNDEVGITTAHPIPWTGGRGTASAPVGVQGRDTGQDPLFAETLTLQVDWVAGPHGPGPVAVAHPPRSRPEEDVSPRVALIMHLVNSCNAAEEGKRQSALARSA
jgi:hypothetical protein